MGDSIYQTPVLFWGRVYKGTIPHLLLLLDTALYVLHFAVLAFALAGWMHACARLLHRWVMASIAFFWLVVGPLVGEIGFCPLTWLQWQLRMARGVEVTHTAYIDDLLSSFGLVFNAQMVDIAASAAFVVLMALAFLHWVLETGSPYNRATRVG